MKLQPCLLLLLLLAPAAAAQNTAPDSVGTIFGRIVSGSSRHSVAYANVIVLGTRRATQTDDEGHFRLTLLPIGLQTLRLLRLGDSSVSQSIRVFPGETALGDLVIEPFAPTTRAPLIIGSEAEVVDSDLIAEIWPIPRKFKVGQSPAFEVRIRNQGSKPVVLVEAGGDWQSQGGGPRVAFEIAAPFNGFVRAREGWAFCGNRSGTGRFIEVMPGESFDPFGSEGGTVVVGWGTLMRPGHYTAKFYYSTKDTDPRAWLNVPCGECVPSKEFIELIARVPAVELEAEADFKVDF